MYAKAGEEVLVKVMHKCQQRRCKKEVDLTPNHCLRKFEQYFNYGSYQQFAEEVMDLVMGLDDLITTFPVCSIINDCLDPGLNGLTFKLISITQRLSEMYRTKEPKDMTGKIFFCLENFEKI